MTARPGPFRGSISAKREEPMLQRDAHRRESASTRRAPM